MGAVGTSLNPRLARIEPSVAKSATQSAMNFDVATRHYDRHERRRTPNHTSHHITVIEDPGRD
jgi:hypothetical protein